MKDEGRQVSSPDPMHWRLHTAIFGFETAAASTLLRNLGDSVQIVSGSVRDLPPVELLPAPMSALAITTLQDAAKNQIGPGVPWLYFDTHAYDVSSWMPRIGSNIPVLNRDGLFLPFGMLQAPCPALLSWIGEEGSVFIRPDSGRKLFTGFVVKVARDGSLSIGHEHQVRLVAPDAMCLVALAKIMEPVEWRFWVVDRKVVASTPYSWDTEPEWAPAPDSCLAVAQAMAANPWQPDIAYVVDVVEHGGQSYLLEINAASTSGIYAAPLEPLLLALRDAAQREYAGEIARED
ncbi:MAG: ATP-grasp domain-containing protein [Pseudomonadota bacterium]|nr:ATP-grasp domain-containing protein [Pseudomonadota bacterium]MDP1905500.1 ATP-grasp domain-containing protein [Pseudomonadota bacterium]